MLDFVVIEPHLPPAHTIEERCIRSASLDMNLDYFVLKAIRGQENGASGKTSASNKNGSYDIAEFQINNRTVADFAEFGITVEKLLTNTCLNVYTAALHLWRKIAETGDLWRGVAWYHSKNSTYGTPYANSVYRRYIKLVDRFSRQVDASAATSRNEVVKTAGR